MKHGQVKRFFICLFSLAAFITVPYYTGKLVGIWDVRLQKEAPANLWAAGLGMLGLLAVVLAALFLVVIYIKQGGDE